MHEQRHYGDLPLALILVLAGMLCMVLLAACDRTTEQRAAGPSYGTVPAQGGKPVLAFAVHPLHNPNRLFERYQPLIDHLNRTLPDIHFVLEASRDYQDFERKLRARAPAFLLPNPWQTIEATKVGYRVLAMAGDPDDFRGIFIVRRDSNIRRPGDLRGQAISYPSPTALAACIMPQYWLHEQGIDIRRETQSLYVGSQESSIMNVFLRETAAGATWPPPWRAFQKEHPREAAELAQIWQTGSLPNNSVMSRSDVPEDVAARVRTTLVGLESTPEGKAILAGMETAHFLPADDRTYDVVRTFIARFEKTVRPVETP